MNPVLVSLPAFTHKKRSEDIDPFFDVLDVPLLRDFSQFPNLKFTPQAQTGVREFLNANNGTTVGLASKQYNLTLNRDATNIVMEFLSKIGLEYKTLGPQVSNNGRRFFQTITFPSLAFNPAKNNPSTALDSKGLHEDFLLPAYTWRNSYDSTSVLRFTQELWRRWCSNGASIPYSKGIMLAFRHNKIVNAEMVRDHLLVGLEESVELGKVLYNRLNSEGGTKYLENVLNSKLSDKFKKMVIDRLQGEANFRLDVKTDPKTGKAKEWVINSATTKNTAYAIWNVVTEISTHEVPNRNQREVIDKKIAKIFISAKD